MNLTGRVEGRGTNLIADLEGSTGQQSQVYRGSMVLEKPFYAQGGAASGGAGPRYWFLLTTNWDCRSVLEHVNAVAGLTGPPFYHPAPNAPLPAPKAATNIDPATGLPWGNRALETPSPAFPCHRTMIRNELLNTLDELACEMVSVNG